MELITHCRTPGGPRAASRHRPCSSGPPGQTRGEDETETSGTGEFSTAPSCSWIPPARAVRNLGGEGRRGANAGSRSRWEMMQRLLHSRLLYLNALTHLSHHLPRRADTAPFKFCRGFPQLAQRSRILVPIPFPISTFCSTSPNFPVLLQPPLFLLFSPSSLSWV